jgi:hypothetical protein
MAIPNAVLQDSDFLPPKTGHPPAIALAANTACVETDTGVTELTVATRPQFITLICDQAFYFVFGVAGMDAPTVAATPGPFSAGVPYSFRISKLERYFRAISTPASSLRWWLSSGPGQ